MSLEILYNIIKDLGYVCIREGGLISGVDKEVESLDETISSLEAILRYAEKKPITSAQVKDRLEKIEVIVHDADDLVDEFRTRVKIQMHDNLFRKLRTFFSRSNLRRAHRVQEVWQRLSKIKDVSALYLPESRQETPDPTTRYFILPDEVIGRDGDKVKIMEQLLDDDVEENVSVIPIVGMGGLGKTTLARSVFDDVVVPRHFELKSWVCVSDPFDLRMILNKVTETNNLEIDQLQKLVREKLHGKRYFLVLDDVWNEDRKKWIDLISFLSGGARGSKILVTTRSYFVARIATGGRDEPYRLSALTEGTSWSLFEKMAFGQKKEPLCSDTMKDIGMEIVKKCGGIPLAIKTIGGLLFNKTTEAEWLAIKDTELVKVSSEGNDILPILKLSYDHLPLELKRCFAYCSLFPKDYKIDVPTLIQLWMAQGFVISPGQGQCLYDVGYEYFMKLLGRSFFQEFREDCYETKDLRFTSTCRMHDLMHDLAKSVASGCVSGLHTTTLDLDMSGKIPKPLLQQQKLRSFISNEFYNDSSHPLGSSGLATILYNFKHLRALGLSCNRITTLSSGLGVLIHLRYLDLSRNDMKQLPKSITRLHNLQTLKLSSCKKLLSLPRDINRLVNLTILDVFGCDKLTHLPRGIGQLTSLRTLGWFPVFNDRKDLPSYAAGIDELSCLDNLKGELEIAINGHGKHALARCKTANLKRKSLDNLRIFWKISSKQDRDASENDEAILDCLQPNLRLKKFVLRWYMGTRVPPWFWSLPNLVTLELFHCHVIKELPSMDQFCGLKKLKLCHLSELEFVSSRTSDDDTTMPLLESLSIWSCPKLKEWRSIEGNNAATDSEDKCRGSQKRQLSQPVFLSLITLEIKGCPNLISLPLMPNVESLDLSYSIQIEHLLQPIGNNGSLRWLSLEHYKSDSLPEDFFKFVSLEFLKIANCSNLTSLPDSIGNLSSLQKLKLSNCSNLVEFPESIRCLKSLQYLDVWGCSNLTSLPDSIGNLSSLQDIFLYNCSNLASLPDSIGNLSSLQKLRLTNCSNLVEFPESIRCLKSLQFLDVWGCSNLTSLLDSIGNLSSLQTILLTNCSNLVSLPDSIGNLSSLQCLSLINCSNLVEFPESIRCLKSLQLLNVSRCPMLEKRCKRNIGEDWPKIAHIPYLYART